MYSKILMLTKKLTAREEKREAGFSGVIHPSEFCPRAGEQSTCALWDPAIGSHVACKFASVDREQKQRCQQVSKAAYQLRVGEAGMGLSGGHLCENQETKTSQQDLVKGRNPAPKPARVLQVSRTRTAQDSVHSEEQRHTGAKWGQKTCHQKERWSQSNQLILCQ